MIFALVRDLYSADGSIVLKSFRNLTWFLTHFFYNLKLGDITTDTSAYGVQFEDLPAATMQCTEKTTER